MKAIFKFKADCGPRGGYLEGVFTSTKEKVDKLIKSELEVYFGTVLGNHGEVYGSVADDQIVLVTDDQEAVEIFEKYDLSGGHNPFDYKSINIAKLGIKDLDDKKTSNLKIDEIIDILLTK